MSTKALSRPPRSAHLTARTHRNRQSHYRSVPGTDICQNTTTVVHFPDQLSLAVAVHTLSFWFDFVVANRNPCAFHDIFSSSVYRMFSSGVGCPHSSIRLLLVSSRAPMKLSVPAADLLQRVTVSPCRLASKPKIVSTITVP